MRIFAVIGLILCIGLPLIIYCILAISGCAGKLMKGFWWKCTNLKESNIKEQKYVLRIYGIKNLILILLGFTGVISLIYEQWIVGGVFIASVFVVWGVIELILLKCKNYQQCKYEISDEKREEEYWKNIKEKSQMDKEKKNFNVEK